MAIDPKPPQDRQDLPTTMFVEIVDFDPPLFQEGRRVGALDAEFTEKNAMLLIQGFIQHMNKFPGGNIRVRLIGPEVKP